LAGIPEVNRPLEIVDVNEINQFNSKDGNKYTKNTHKQTNTQRQKAKIWHLVLFRQ
jgi:hypothetical protein